LTTARPNPEDSLLTGLSTVIFDVGSTLKHTHAWDWYDDARPCLKRLSATHRLLVGANQPSLMLGYLEASGLAQYFHHIYLSESIGYRKPDSQFFLHILGQEGLKPSEVAMVGDELINDIAPANDLGIRSIWIKRGLGLELAKVLRLEDKIKPDHVIRTLDELR
jgi:FMN phosphatase YigB (HAD superfamily)